MKSVRYTIEDLDIVDSCDIEVFFDESLPEPEVNWAGGLDYCNWQLVNGSRPLTEEEEVVIDHWVENHLDTLRGKLNEELQAEEEYAMEQRADWLRERKYDD